MGWGKTEGDWDVFLGCALVGVGVHVIMYDDDGGCGWGVYIRWHSCCTSIFRGAIEAFLDSLPSVKMLIKLASLATASALLAITAALPAAAATCLVTTQFSADLDQLFSCPAAAWPPGPGNPLEPQAPDAELQQIMSEIDPKRIQAIIEKLVSFGTRNTLSNQTDPNRGIGAARDWIAGQMREFAKASGGRMTVTVPGYVQGVEKTIPFPVRISNVVATLRGETDPGRVYVVR